MGPAELLELGPGYHLPGEGRIGLEGGVLCLLSSPAFSPAGVGKSSLLLRFADNTFSGECTPGVLLWCFGFEIPFPGARTYLPLPNVRNIVIPVAV